MGVMTLKCIREILRIPPKYKITWAIITEKHNDESKQHVGITFLGTKLCFDIATWRFRSELKIRDIEISASNAIKKRRDDGLFFVADNGTTLRLPLNYFDVVIYQRTFSPELLGDVLL